MSEDSMKKEKPNKGKRCREKKRRFRIMSSYQKERMWLEEMALQGWFLTDISLGMIYTFTKDEPKHMLYDIDRFSLPKKPTLEEIRHKEMFLEMAQELGWQEVTHSEDMTYYFAKEYEEGGVNELHNDSESRRFLAEKYLRCFSYHAKQQVFWAAVLALADIFEKLVQILMKENFGLGWFDWFALIYVVICNFFAVYLWKLGVRTEKELSMSRQEWENSVNPDTHKTVRKLIWTNRGLNKFLRRQEEQGWLLTSVTPTKYSFEKSRGGSWIYTMDSKSLTNKRRKAANREKFEDGKDWTGINNDWEIASVQDAEEKGWTFVCALENRAVIYRGETSAVQPLNDARYDNSLRWISLIGEYSFYLLCCGVIGGIVGFAIAYFRN